MSAWYGSHAISCVHRYAAATMTVAATTATATGSAPGAPIVRARSSGHVATIANTISAITAVSGPYAAGTPRVASESCGHAHASASADSATSHGALMVRNDSFSRARFRGPTTIAPAPRRST